jgi:mono/diheme cytochrome c family protein
MFKMNSVKAALICWTLLAAAFIFAFVATGKIPKDKLNARMDPFYNQLPALDDQIDFAPVKGSHMLGIDPTRLITGDDELKAKGQEIFQAVCATCHGVTGKGDGPAGLALGARNFTLSDGWKQGHKVTDVFRTVSKGLAPLMPAYDYMSMEDRCGLAIYVSSLGEFDHGEPSKAELAAFDTEFSFSAGVQEPNKIGVSVAAQIYASTNAASKVNLLGLKTEELLTFGSLIIDEQRAAATLSGLENWKNDLSLMANSLLTNAPGNGFSTSIADLNKSEWKRFQRMIELN